MSTWTGTGETEQDTHDDADGGRGTGVLTLNTDRTPLVGGGVTGGETSRTWSTRRTTRDLVGSGPSHSVLLGGGPGRPWGGSG